MYLNKDTLLYIPDRLHSSLHILVDNYECEVVFVNYQSLYRNFNFNLSDRKFRTGQRMKGIPDLMNCKGAESEVYTFHLYQYFWLYPKTLQIHSNTYNLRVVSQTVYHWRVICQIFYRCSFLNNVWSEHSRQFC